MSRLAPEARVFWRAVAVVYAVVIACVAALVVKAFWEWI
jgi:hypothetical protein